MPAKPEPQGVARVENYIYRKRPRSQVIIRNTVIDEQMVDFHAKAVAAKINAAIAPLLSAADRMAEALDAAEQALTDWLVSYADDQCDKKDVAEARKRIGKVGTLAYIGQACDRAREAKAAYRRERAK